MADDPVSRAYSMRVARSFDPAGFLYDFERPRLKNADGSFSTEETITVQFGDRYYNVPTIWDGQRLSPDMAIERAAAEIRRGTTFPNFASLQEAEKQAGLRSQWRGRLEQLGY